MKNVALVLLTILTGSPALLADEIIMFTGKDLKNVKVREETYEYVKFRMEGISSLQQRTVSQVKEVRYSQHSDRFMDGQAAWADGNLDRAVNYFKAAAANKASAFEWERQYSLYHAAECMRLQKKYDEAIKALDELLTQVPKTKFYGNTFEQKALSYEAKGDKAKARATYEEMKKVSTKIGERWDKLAQFHLIRLDAEKDPSAAFTKYEELQATASAAGLNDIANLARLGVGRALIQQNKITDARAYFDDIIRDRKASPTVVVAGAYNGLGRTYVTAKEPSREDFENAMFPFLRVVFMYGDELGQNPMVAEALYWAGRCCEVREEAGDEASKRLRLYLYNRCINEFPNSTWAREAGLRK